MIWGSLLAEAKAPNRRAVQRGSDRGTKLLFDGLSSTA